MPSLAEGQEVLVVDGDEKVRAGLSALLTSTGLVPTVVPDPEKALELSREKFFAVALIDLDTPTAGDGVQLIARMNAVSPATVVLMMASRKAFDVAVAAFRAGAQDVIIKSPEQVPFLKERVVAAAVGKRRAADTSRLVEDVLGLHEEMMGVLLTAYRKANDLEEKSLAVDELPMDDDTHVLVVDQDGWLQSQLGMMLQAKGGYVLRGAGTGGEALDLIGRQRFQIALVRDDLPDLPGTMVVRAIKNQSPETIALLYAAPSETKAGSMQVCETSRVIPFLQKFSDPTQILERLDELRDAFRATSRERRLLGSFRQQHFDLLRRYAELKQKLQRTVALENSSPLGLPIFRR